jgi:uncharacterized membrane protein
MLIGYMSLVHLSVLHGKLGMAFLLLLLPALLLMLPNGTARLVAGLLFLFALYFGLDTVIAQGPPLFYLPPILINLMLAILFGRTLRPGQTPLITQYSILIRGKLEPDVVSYTRRVTQLWTLFFIFMATQSLLLALFAPVEIWSLFVNLLNYLFTLMLFVGEFLFRVRYLSSLEHPGFLQFITAITNTHVSKIKRN